MPPARAWRFSDHLPDRSGVHVSGHRRLPGKVIDLYLADSRELLDSLRQAASRADAPRLQRAAHTLKSSSANVGAVGLAERCRELESAARDGALAGAREIVHGIESEHRTVCAALERAGIPRAS